MVAIKRIYEAKEDTDGYRVLVDRLWPRGLSREKAQVDFWFKEIAPSDELRTWFHHKGGSWEEFVKRYKQELENNREVVRHLRSLVHEHQTITLLYGAKDPEHNQAVVLREILS